MLYTCAECCSPTMVCNFLSRPRPRPRLPPSLFPLNPLCAMTNPFDELKGRKMSCKMTPGQVQ